MLAPCSLVWAFHDDGKGPVLFRKFVIDLQGSPSFTLRGSVDCEEFFVSGEREIGVHF
jgi:hypothetical protein